MVLNWTSQTTCVEIICSSSSVYYSDFGSQLGMDETVFLVSVSRISDFNFCIVWLLSIGRSDCSDAGHPEGPC